MEGRRGAEEDLRSCFRVFFWCKEGKNKKKRNRGGRRGERKTRLGVRSTEVSLLSRLLFPKQSIEPFKKPSSSLSAALHAFLSSNFSTRGKGRLEHTTSCLGDVHS